MMSNGLSRRMFLRLSAAASTSIIVGFDPRARSWVTEAQAQPQSLQKAPKLDGSLVYDEASCTAVATDHGNFIHRQPLAVLKPGSVQDVVKMVRYANQHHLKIVMRGQGHSRSGETLVEAGIVIDSRTLNAVRLGSTESVDAEPGATLGEVYKVTLAKGLTLPAMPTCTMLSVGGVLSVGGWGGSSHLFGAAVDNVQELDVVTGDGRLITCSPGKQSELFNMVLAGLGQCALIVRARIRLVPAPSHVAHQDLLYDDLEIYIGDQKRLILDGRFDQQNGRVIKRTDGGWNFSIEVRKFYTAPKEPDLSALEVGLRFNSKSEPTRLSYWDYIGPEAANNAATVAARATRRLGDFVMFVPGSVTRDFTTKILATMSESAFGPASFGFVPLNMRRFTRPLFSLPAEDVAFSLWLFPRTVPANDTAAHAAMMAETRAISERMRAVGGKCYPAHSAFSFSQDDWKNHYGPDTWQRLSAAKKKFDPNNVLTPGPGIFADRS